MNKIDGPESRQTLPTGVVDSVDEFGKALVHSAFENPINGVVQLTNHLFKTHIKELALCKPADDNSSAAVAGNIAGQALDMFALAVLTRGRADLVAGEKVTYFASRLEVGSAVGKSLAKGASIGFIYGCALTPSDGSSEHFFGDRMQSGVINAAVFGTMAGTATSMALQNAELLAPLRSVLSNVKLGAVAGAAGGMAGAEATTIVNDGKPLASASDLVSSAASGALFGAIYGGVVSSAYRLAGPATRPTLSELGKLDMLCDEQGRPVQLKSHGLIDLKAAAQGEKPPPASASMSLVKDGWGNLIEIKITTPALAVHNGVDTWRARQQVNGNWTADVRTLYSDGASVVSKADSEPVLSGRAHGPARLKGGVITTESTDGHYVELLKAPRLTIDGLGDRMGTATGFRFLRKPFFWNTLFLGEQSETYEIYPPTLAKPALKPSNVVSFAELVNRREK